MGDNGPGELSEKILEPYYTTKAEGTGLGLAIVKKIVLQHGGSIALPRSTMDGAAFVILLPPLDKTRAVRIPSRSARKSLPEPRSPRPAT